jgi:hypothetical protein
MTYLFTLTALFAIAGVALFANRQQRLSTDNLQVNTKQICQELRVIAGGGRHPARCHCGQDTIGLDAKFMERRCECPSAHLILRPAHDRQRG